MAGIAAIAWGLMLAWFGGAAPLVMPPPGALLTLSRGPCYGFCPVFDLTIFEDGRVEYVGHAHVRVTGHQRGHLPASKMRAIKAAIRSAHFADFKAAYPCGWTDNPAATICVGAEHPHCVTYEPRHDDPRGGAPTGAPEALEDLVAAIESAASVPAWVDEATPP